MVAATTPKSDIPFSMGDSKQLKKQFEFNEEKMEEPTAVSTNQMTKTSEGDYSHIRQTTTNQ